MLKKRQSVRKYISQPVEKEKIDKLISAVHFSPSACNSQPWRLIIVDEPELKNEVAKATFSKTIAFNKFAVEAPVIAVLVIEKAKLIAKIGGSLKNQEYPMYDIGIAAAHFCLQAAELGLGTCMIGWFDEKKVKEILHIPRGKRPQLIITLGYPASETRNKIRKPKEDVVNFNTY